jgi:hypothetical protein
MPATCQDPLGNVLIGPQREFSVSNLFQIGSKRLFALPKGSL